MIYAQAKKKKKKKKPISAITPQAKKEPRISYNVEEFYQKRASWHVRILDREGPFGWELVTQNDVWKILNKMGEFEQLKWGEIIGENNHFIEIANLNSAVKKRLREIKQNRVDELFSLRLKSRERVIGIMEGGVLKILWWDPEHQVCPSPKKHT